MHNKSKPRDFSQLAAQRRLGNRGVSAGASRAKSGDSAVVSWDPYLGRNTAKPSRQSARSACSASGKLPLAIDLRQGGAILGAITWCETGLEPPALRQTQARPDHSDSIVAVPVTKASTASPGILPFDRD